MYPEKLQDKDKAGPKLSYHKQKVQLSKKKMEYTMMLGKKHFCKGSRNWAMRLLASLYTDSKVVNP